MGIPGLSPGPEVQWGIPRVGLDHGLSGFGNGSEGPYENNNRSIQFIDNLSWIRGKHSFKFGGEFRNDEYRQVGNQFARGEFRFIRNATRNPGVAGVTGDSFADFLLGQPYQAEAAVSIANADFRANTMYFYVDDTWKISNRVTLNFGLRYENTPPWEDQTGNLFNAIVPYEHHPTDFRNAQPARNMFPYFLRQGEARQNCFEGIAIKPWPADPAACDQRLRTAGCALRWFSRQPACRSRQQRLGSSLRDHMGTDGQMGHPDRRRHVLFAGHGQSPIRHGS